IAMLLLRLFRARDEHAAEVEATDTAPPREYALGHLAQHRQTRQRADQQMELGIEAGPLRVPLRFDGFVHVVDQVPERIQLARVPSLRDEPRGDDLEALEHGENVLNRLARNRSDGGASVRNGHDEALRLEDLNRFAHRNDADLEAPCEIVDDQPL